MHRLFQALDARLRITPLIQTFRQTQPSGYISPWAAPPISPGRISLLLIGLLLLSGLGLTLFYNPTAEGAAASLANLHEEQPFGWLLHNIHRWSALLLFVFITLHALRVWVTRAFLYPRDLNWWIGISLLLAAIILGGTGYLLRWDIKAFTLMDLVLSSLSGVPLLGPLLIGLILGGTGSDLVPLYRGYALHVWFLPAVLFAILTFHLLLVWRQGIVEFSPLWRYITGRLPLNRWVHLLPGLGLLVVLLLLSLITPHMEEVDPSYTSTRPHPDWLLLFYMLPFWFFKGQTRVLGALFLPIIALVFLILAPRLLSWITRPVLLTVLVIAGVVIVFLLLGQMSVMGSQVPLQGCQACHQPAMIDSAPTQLSDFDIRDPDWVIFHLQDPTGSLLVPFSDPR